MATAPKSSLASAMADAFAEFEAAAKAANNPHFKSKYADLPAVMDAIKPALVKNRLFFTQATHEMDGGVCIETVVHHESGEHMSFGRLFVPASKQDAHGYGSALTYARRYSLMTAFGIPAEDDDGNAASKSAANDTPAQRDEPAPREKLDGKHSSKTALATALRAYGLKVSNAGTVRELDAICEEYAEDLKQGERYLPKWMKGDPEQDSKGLAKLTDERRLFLELLDRMRENRSQKALSAWLGAYTEEIENLDDGQGRGFERALAEHEAGLKAVATVAAG
jgi:hypothetical protein